ncbi:hypothetical protein Tco_1241734 [Tanacetum coccineum]
MERETRGFQNSKKKRRIEDTNFRHYEDESGGRGEDRCFKKEDPGYDFDLVKDDISNSIPWKDQRTVLTQYLMLSPLFMVTIFPSGMSLGNVCHGSTSCLTEKYVGPTLLLGIVAEERIPSERSPASVPQRLVAGERYPQRQVDGESPEFSPGKRANVVMYVA